MSRYIYMCLEKNDVTRVSKFVIKVSHNSSDITLLLTKIHLKKKKKN